MRDVERPVVMALVWFFTMGGLGVWFPYVSLYLHENAGLSGSQVGQVIALIPLVGLVAQPFWGQVSDRTGSRTRVLALLAFGAACGYVLVGGARGFPSIAASVAAMALFGAALVPMAFSVTLALARDSAAREVGLTRAAGTVGFLTTVVAFPALLHRFQDARGLSSAVDSAVSEPGLEIMFPLTGALVAIAGLLSFALPRGGGEALRAERGAWTLLLRHGPFLRVLVFGMLAFLCLQGPQVFFPVFVRSLGGGVDDVSRMWILMVALEIPLIAYSGLTLRRLGARGLLAMGLAAGGLRWSVCGFAPDLAWVWPVQILHGVVVAGIIVGGPLYVEAVVPERLRSTGQGVYAMFAFSAGGIFSNLIAGWLVDHVGAAAPYACGGVGALLLTLSIPLLLPAPRRG
jgi:PPP family 3-phenylpropionic acid transporter